MKEIETIYKETRNILYPLYEEDDIEKELVEALGADIRAMIIEEAGKTTTITTLGRLACERIVFLFLGSRQDTDREAVCSCAEGVFDSLNAPFVVWVDKAVNASMDAHLITSCFIRALYGKAYIKKKDDPDITFLSEEDLTQDVQTAMIYADGKKYARRLSDLPPNVMTPKELCQQAVALAQTYGMKCRVLSTAELKEMNAGGLLAVSQGSAYPPYLICLTYDHGGNAPYQAVIGKGITFDSGGYNLKSRTSFGMKYDMCGAADVLGVMKILAELRAEVNVYGILPVTENLISQQAYKSQDVIQLMSGKTIEITNTDAEGRLILADAITYAQRLNANRIVDIATLTGACVTALGNVYSGIFSNDDAFFQSFSDSMKQTGERGWRMPLDAAYLQDLTSNCADLRNAATGNGKGGACVAAAFLSQFIETDVKWLHIDIAGTSDEKDCATGAMISSVANFLIQEAQQL